MRHLVEVRPPYRPRMSTKDADRCIMVGYILGVLVPVAVVYMDIGWTAT